MSSIDGLSYDPRKDMAQCQVQQGQGGAAEAKTGMKIIQKKDGAYLVVPVSNRVEQVRVHILDTRDRRTAPSRAVTQKLEQVSGTVIRLQDASGRPVSVVIDDAHLLEQLKSTSAIRSVFEYAFRAQSKIDIVRQIEAERPPKELEQPAPTLLLRDELLDRTSLHTDQIAVSSQVDEPPLPPETSSPGVPPVPTTTGTLVLNKKESRDVREQALEKEIISHTKFLQNRGAMIAQIAQVAMSAIGEIAVAHDPIYVRYPISIGSHSILVRKHEDETVSLLHFAQLLGAGTYGRVYIAEDLITGYTQIAKVPRISERGVVRSEVQEYLMHERSILLEIHQNGQVPGIMDAPHSLFQIVERPEGREKAIQYTGYFTRQYRGDLSGSLTLATRRPSKAHLEVGSMGSGSLSPSQQFVLVLTLARPLIGAVRHMARVGICHGDIKPGNCLYDIALDGTIIDVLSDFSAADYVSKTQGWIKPYTKAYVSPDDERAYGEKKAEQERDPTNILVQAALQHIQLKRDVYALGKTLEHLMAVNFGTPQPDSPQYADWKNYQAFAQGLQDPSWKTRPNAAEMADRFAALFPLDQYPPLVALAASP